MFAMIDKSPEKIKIPEQPRKEIVEIDKYETDEQLFSDENMLYINNLIKNRQLPTENNETIVRITPGTNREDNIFTGNNLLARQLPLTLSPIRRTHTLVGRSRTQDEYRQLTLNYH